MKKEKGVGDEVEERQGSGRREETGLWYMKHLSP